MNVAKSTSPDAVRGGARRAHENGEAGEMGIFVEQRRRHPQLWQPADRHRIANQIDADLVAVVAAGEAGKLVGAMRKRRIIERTGAAVEHAAARGLGDAMVVHADVGDGGDGAGSEEK